MKKVLAIILCIILTAACFGCGEDSNTDSDSKKSFETGSVTNDRYKNSYFDIKFNLPDGWRFYSREELTSLSGLANDIVDNEKFDFENISGFIDMMAGSDSNSCNINISYEKATVSVSKYVAALKSNFTAMANDNYSVTVKDETDYKLAGEKYTLITTDTVAMGVSMKQYVLLRKESGVFCVITATIVNDAYTLDELASYFK